MSLEMEAPKMLWLKRHMPTEIFEQSMFFDLPDLLTYKATGDLARSNCSLACKCSYVPPGVEGSKGWNDEFFTKIGLEVFVSLAARRLADNRLRALAHFHSRRSAQDQLQASRRYSRSIRPDPHCGTARRQGSFSKGGRRTGSSRGNSRRLRCDRCLRWMGGYRRSANGRTSNNQPQRLQVPPRRHRRNFDLPHRSESRCRIRARSVGPVQACYFPRM